MPESRIIFRLFCKMRRAIKKLDSQLTAFNDANQRVCAPQRTVRRAQVWSRSCFRVQDLTRVNDVTFCLVYNRSSKRREVEIREVKAKFCRLNGNYDVLYDNLLLYLQEWQVYKMTCKKLCFVTYRRIIHYCRYDRWLTQQLESSEFL